MKSSKRYFLKFIGTSVISTLLFPYSFLLAVKKEIINPKQIKMKDKKQK